MTNMIKRWECPECGWKASFGGVHMRPSLNPRRPDWCSGVPVERIYMLVDDVPDLVIDAMAEAESDSVDDERVAGFTRLADSLRKSAHRLAKDRDRLLSQAKAAEQRAGIPGPCHLCGHRYGCSH